MSTGGSDPLPAGAIALVVSTAPERETAQRLASALLAERLIACANLLPGITSLYRWKGAVQREEEVLLLFKTAAERVPALLERIRALHPYAVPEALQLPVGGGLEEYRRWVRAETDAVDVAATPGAGTSSGHRE